MRLRFAAALLAGACVVRAHAAGMPDVRRVVIVMLENEDEPRALRAPFLEELASRGALLRNYHAVTHPSQPNYIALVAGSTFGVRTDRNVTLRASNLGDLLEEKNLGWKVYAEDYPGGCFLGKRSGQYVRKHVPFLSFEDVQSNAARCAAHVVDASEFDSDIAHGSLPQYSMYIPNLDDDGHDTNVSTADAWLRRRFGALVADPRFIDGTLLVSTRDARSARTSCIARCTVRVFSRVRFRTCDTTTTAFSALSKTCSSSARCIRPTRQLA